MYCVVAGEYDAFPLPKCRMSTEAGHVEGASTEALNLLKRNSEDVGWEHGVLVDANNKDKVKCKFCDKEMREGGIYRLKEHLAHVGKNVKKCPAKTPEALEAKEKFKKAIEALQELGACKGKPAGNRICLLALFLILTVAHIY